MPSFSVERLQILIYFTINLLILSRQTATITVLLSVSAWFFLVLHYFCVHCNINSHLQRNTMFCLLNDCQFLRELACPELLSVWVAQHSYVRSSAEEKQSRCTELLSHIDFVNTNSVIWRIPEMRNCSSFLNRLWRVKLSASSIYHLPACCYVLGLSQDEIVRASESGSAPVFFLFSGHCHNLLALECSVMQSALKLMDHNVPRIKL